jgi:hypothetical protein
MSPIRGARRNAPLNNFSNTNLPYPEHTLLIFMETDRINDANHADRNV